MSTFVNLLGIEGDSYLIGGPIAGVRLKNAAGIFQTRNNADTLFADAYLGNTRCNDPIVGVNDAGAVIANGVVRHSTGVQSFGGAPSGNARGVGASDLQTSRTAPTQVASGLRASILGGQNNTASGTNSLAGGATCLASGTTSVAMGSLSTASNTSAVAIGSSCSASGLNATAFGDTGVASGATSFASGRTVTASGTSAAAFGQESLASADYSTAMGLQAISDAQGMVSFSGGRIAANGDSETCLVTWGGSTVGLATGSLGLDGVLGSAIELVLPATALIGSCYSFDLFVSAEQVGGISGHVFQFLGGIRRPSGPGAAVFITGVAPLASFTATDAAISAAAVVLSATAAGVFRITVTGVVGLTLHWTATARIARATG